MLQMGMKQMEAVKWYFIALERWLCFVEAIPVEVLQELLLILSYLKFREIAEQKRIGSMLV